MGTVDKVKLGGLSFFKTYYKQFNSSFLGFPFNYESTVSRIRKKSKPGAAYAIHSVLFL